MPAGSEAASGLPALPHTWRPIGVRVAGALVGGGLLVLCVVVWFAFPPEIRAQFTLFQRGTLVVLLAGFLGVYYALARARIEARPDRLVVVNGFRRRELAWAQVVAVTMPPGAPWVRLDLSDGTTMSAMGIQAADGARARTALRELQGLVGRQ